MEYLQNMAYSHMYVVDATSDSECSNPCFHQCLAHTSDACWCQSVEFLPWEPDQSANVYTESPYPTHSESMCIHRVYAGYNGEASKKKNISKVKGLHLGWVNAAQVSHLIGPLEYNGWKLAGTPSARQNGYLDFCKLEDHGIWMLSGILCFMSSSCWTFKREAQKCPCQPQVPQVHDVRNGKLCNIKP